MTWWLPWGGVGDLQIGGLAHLRRPDADVTAFNTRDLSAQAFPYVFPDATYCKACIGGDKAGKGSEWLPQAVVIATGVAADGRREVLGCAVGDSETEAFWSEFLRSLRERGLAGVQLVISITTADYAMPSTL